MAPFPDDEALAALAARLSQLDGDHGAIPSAELVALTGLEGDLTVDYRPRGLLGHPLVVWQPARQGPPAWWARLTEREREVALRITDGLANQAIAARLGLRMGTVKDHVHAILKKSGLRRRTQVAALLAPIQDVLEPEGDPRTPDDLRH